MPMLGWLFEGFNRLFDLVTVGYSWTIGKLLRIKCGRAFGLRMLGGADIVGFNAPDGLHSAAGPGTVDCQRSAT